MLLQKRRRQSCVITECSRVATEEGAPVLHYNSVLVLLQERGHQSCVITECSRVATGAGAPVLCYN